ncbi:MAG TPA: PP0621 family protein [Burkholderiales bacterium]|nr:PP0621 family protein [Burkholderiales bacterium]
MLIAVILVIYWIVSTHRRSQRRAEGEDMVQCRQCGVHLPKSESIVTRGQFFCSEAHRQLYDQGPQ